MGRVNFTIRQGDSFWDKQDDFARLYRDGVKTDDIIHELDLTSAQYCKLVGECSKKGLITRRRKPLPRKKKPVKNYTYNNHCRGYIVRHKNEYFGYYPNKNEVELAVSILREHDWNIDYRKVRKMVFEELYG